MRDATRVFIAPLGTPAAFGRHLPVRGVDVGALLENRIRGEVVRQRWAKATARLNAVSVDGMR